MPAKETKKKPAAAADEATIEALTAAIQSGSGLPAVAAQRRPCWTRASR